MDATTSAVWGAIVLVLVRTVAELIKKPSSTCSKEVTNTLNELKDSIVSVKSEVHTILQMHEPGPNGIQGWKGVPEVRRLIEQEVIPVLYRLERNLLDGR